jgi:hypothetical protein
MGEEISKEKNIESNQPVPVLEEAVGSVEHPREALSSISVLSNRIGNMGKDDVCDFAKGKGTKVEIRLKKTKDLLKTIKENEQENEDIEDLNIRTHRAREPVLKSGKKNLQSDWRLESKTLPVLGLQLGDQGETRLRKFRVTRLL